MPKRGDIMKNSSTYGYIHELATLTKFSRIDLKHAIEETGIHLGESSFKVLLQKLLNEGEISRIGRNAYCVTEGRYNSYGYQYSDLAINIANNMEQKYPHLDFSIFELIQLNEFLNHQIAHNVVYVSVEEDLSPFVFEFLKELYPGKVLLNPTVEEYHTYWYDNMIVVNKLVSEAPKGTQENWKVRIEKLLVDLLTSKLLRSSVSDAEVPEIYQEIFDKYIVDESCMFRYAKRRAADKKIRKFIKEETNIKLRLE